METSHNENEGQEKVDYERHTGVFAVAVWFNAANELAIRLAICAEKSHRASKRQRFQKRDYYVDDHGLSIYFCKIDAKLAVRDLMEGRFGSEVWMEMLRHNLAFCT